jgi:hypothetical protein
MAPKVVVSMVVLLMRMLAAPTVNVMSEVATQVGSPRNSTRLSGSLLSVA